MCIARAGRHRHIQNLAGSRSPSGFRYRTGSGVSAIMMCAEIKDRSVIIKNVLGAVAVVIIPVHDQHAADAMLLLQIPGSNGDIIEDAESHTAIRCGVMARRAYGSESIPDFTVHHRVHHVQNSAGSEFRSL